MSRKIIISRTYRKANPLIAFLMSFFFTGLGQIYTGSLYRGITFLLLKLIVILIPPFLLLYNPGYSRLNEVFYAILILAALILLSSIDAVVKSIKAPQIQAKRYNTAAFYIIFSIAGTILTLLSIIFFMFFFNFHRTAESAEPLFETNDLILISRIPGREYFHGEAVLIKSGNAFSIKRIIAVPGEKASYRNSRFSVDGSELPLSIFSENELRKMPLSSYDVVSELNGSYKYPVRQKKGKSVIKFNLNENEYLTASDDREIENFYTQIRTPEIWGRVEGSLIAFNRKKILIKPFIKGE